MQQRNVDYHSCSSVYQLSVRMQNEQGKKKKKKKKKTDMNAYVCLSESSRVFLLCVEYQQRLPAVHVFRQQFLLSAAYLGITEM